MKKWPTPNRMTLRTKGAEKNANNLGTFLLNIPIIHVFIKRLDDKCTMYYEESIQLYNIIIRRLVC